MGILNTLLNKVDKESFDRLYKDYLSLLDNYAILESELNVIKEFHNDFLRNHVDEI